MMSNSLSKRGILIKKVKTKRIIQSISSITLVFVFCSYPVFACTGFTSHDDIVLVGHNKDWWSPDTWIHVYPSNENTYARLFFEIPYPHIFNNDYKVLAGGFNEHGLCFESFVTPFKLTSFEFFKPFIFKNPVDFLMQKYSSVQQVIDYIESHNLFFLNYILSSGQIFVVDKTGDAAIIEGDEIIRINGDFQVCTNFLQSDPSLGGYPCWRYETTFTTLENITDLTIPLFTSILNATHQQWFTQYSWIYNMQTNKIHLYHYSDFENPIILDLTKEFSQNPHSYYFPSLFEPEENKIPLKPETPSGQGLNKPRQDIIFQTNTSDQDNLPTEIYYQWDFGDGTQTYWLHNRPPYWGKASHSFKKPGIYGIKVRARDIYGKESPWSESFQITIKSGIPIMDLLF